jgi:phosphoenolpyruvate---glycerone phosphotransferase subunit DhaL
VSASALSAQDLRNALTFAAARFCQEESRLCALDAAIGDGDHGITMRLGFEAIAAALAELSPSARPDEVFQAAGTAFMGATGGASGIIFGRMFTAAGRALKGQTDLGPVEFMTMLRAMETGVAQAGKAQPGDRTALDAIHAAAAAPLQADLLTTMRIVAAAAEDAAAGTAQMLCKVGRASKLGNRVLGHPDPGATSFGVLLRALADKAETAIP